MKDPIALFRKADMHRFMNEFSEAVVVFDEAVEAGLLRADISDLARDGFAMFREHCLAEAAAMQERMAYWAEG